MSTKPHRRKCKQLNYVSNGVEFSFAKVDQRTAETMMFFSRDVEPVVSRRGARVPQTGFELWAERDNMCLKGYCRNGATVELIGNGR